MRREALADLAGSASPADDARRSATALGRQIGRGQHAGEAGRRAEEHGRALSSIAPVQRLKTASGVGRSAISTTVAPTLSGKLSELPRP